MSSTIRIAGIEPESFVDGEGIRYVVFVQGCPHNCKGCHNPQTHSFEFGYNAEISSIIRQMNENPLLSGLTISGGEPLCQIPQCIELVKAVKEYDETLTIWLYTGYTFEEAKKLDKFDELLPYLDVIVDGRYVEDLRDLTLEFRGSSNQRLIRLKNKSEVG